MVSRLRLLKAAYCILGIFFTFFIVLAWIVESRPNLLPWAKTHMFVILLGGCISSAALGIYLVFLFLYWDRYGSKIKDVRNTDLLGRFLTPLAFFMISFIFLGKIGGLTKQAWLENISDVGQKILIAEVILITIIYFILRKLGKIPHR